MDFLSFFRAGILSSTHPVDKFKTKFDASTGHLTRFWTVIFTALGIAQASCGKADSATLLKSTTTSVIGDQELTSNRNGYLGLPKSLATSHVLISRDQYIIAYNPARRGPDWAMWQVRPDDLGTVKRSIEFQVDPDLEAANIPIVRRSDYSNSCLTKGHQIPSADRTARIDANQRTFYMSNMVPQTTYLNSFIWESLEKFSRELVQKGQVLYVIAGTIYSQQPKGIGPNRDIMVPIKNYKVVADESGHVIAAVVMPNTTSKGTDPIDDLDVTCSEFSHLGTIERTKKWSDFTTTKEQIEAEANVDLSFLTFASK
jgi:endonuclease G